MLALKESEENTDTDYFTEHVIKNPILGGERRKYFFPMQGMKSMVMKVNCQKHDVHIHKMYCK